MEIVLWGVRGSIASPGGGTGFYGANTPCIELLTSSGQELIFDAGTGLRALGANLPISGNCSLFFSHAHSDHIQGLGFFKPLFSPDWTVDIYQPDWLPNIFSNYFNGLNHPVRLAEIQAEVRVHRLPEEHELALGSGAATVKVRTFAANHPGGGLAYKVWADDAVFLYSGDHEISNDPGVRRSTQAMLKGTDLAIVDAAYTRKGYPNKINWGHSAWEDWVDMAAESDAKRLVLFHHASERSDLELDAIQKRLDEKNTPAFHVCVAREGMHLNPSRPPEASFTSDWLETFIEDLSRYKEESAILDRILFKAREITRADAGTVYLADKDELVFAYTHNDSLFPVDQAYKHLYSTMRLPITDTSIAGYAAVTGKILNIPDAYNILATASYSFNPSFDFSSGYRTSSILTVPLAVRGTKLLGVLQLLNSMNPYNGKPQPFTAAMEAAVRLLAREAAAVLENSNTVQSNIERLLKVTELHDPTETGPHAQRVGALAAEIYQVWAERRKLDADLIRHFRSQLRLAAMLHDVGKVGISDLVLKKNGKLDDNEFALMKSHTWRGASLFEADSQDINELAHDISLNHHQKWDGKGYSGSPDYPVLSGEDIPLAARISAIADVYDALISPRCYKEPWTHERALQELSDCAGTHFDPDLVDCFLSIQDTVRQIYARYPDHKPETE